MSTCETWYERSCNDDPQTPGNNCKTDDQCDDGSCKGGHCCAYSGRLAECTSCDGSGDCSSCSSGYVLSSSYECQKERTCLSAILACRACSLLVIHNCPPASTCQRRLHSSERDAGCVWHRPPPLRCPNSVAGSTLP